MSKAFITALDMLRFEMDSANLRLLGKMPPLVTITFGDVETEARFHEFILRGNTKEDAMQFARDHRGTTLRPDCLCTISGIEVRLSSDQRIDDIVRRMFK